MQSNCKHRIYRPLTPRQSIGRLQFSSTALCPKLVSKFGFIGGLFAAILVWLIFSNCFLAYHGFVYLEDSKRVCLVTLLCGLGNILHYVIHSQAKAIKDL